MNRSISATATAWGLKALRDGFGARANVSFTRSALSRTLGHLSRQPAGGPGAAMFPVGGSVRPS